MTFRLTPYEPPASSNEPDLARPEPVEGMRPRADMGVKHLQRAKKIVDDEFYTPRALIEDEFVNFTDHFRGKWVHLPCDDPLHSQFFRVFAERFQEYGLRRLTACYHMPGRGRPWITSFDGNVWEQRRVSWTGDFQVGENEAMIRAADLICTNPPFSLFLELVDRLERWGKEYLLLGHLSAFGNGCTLRPSLEGRFFGGQRVGHSDNFIRPDGSLKPVNVSWWTNLDFQGRHERRVDLVKSYSPAAYPEFDNYPAINVNWIAEIPGDYDGLMGLPVTAIGKCIPAQFRLLGVGIGLVLHGRVVFKRLLVQRVGASPAADCPDVPGVVRSLGRRVEQGAGFGDGKRFFGPNEARRRRSKVKS